MATGPSTQEPVRVPDFDIYPITRTITSAQAQGRAVEICWSDGTIHHYHVEMLRENAPDAGTTHPVTREQVIGLLDLPADLAATQTHLLQNGDLEVCWNWGATSVFHAGWLSALAPGAKGYALPERQAWNDGMSVPRVNGTAALSHPAAFEEACTALHIWGAVIIEGLPATAETIETFPARIGPIRETSFGKFFDVVNMPDATSNAYTTLGLPLHMDLPTREYMPGLQFLHCLKNDATGGESTLADARRIGMRLKETNPEAFETLTTLPMTFADKSKITDYRVTAPFFELDRGGAVTGARWAAWLRAPHRGDFAETDRLYKALRAVYTLGQDPEMMVTTKLGAGDLLAFDNRRVLHGRTAYDLSTGGRHLRGCYVEREDLVSRLRILARERRAASLSG